MGGPFYLGVDGGGTKTVALVADGAGRVIGRSEAGASNLHSEGREAAETAYHGHVAIQVHYGCDWCPPRLRRAAVAASAAMSTSIPALSMAGT